MTLSRETLNGWVGSIVFHALLFLFLFLVSVPDVIRQQEFIEVVWGSPSRALPVPVMAQTERGLLQAKESSSQPVVSTGTKKPSQPVILPERKMLDPSSEILPSSNARKLEIPEKGLESKIAEPVKIGDRDAVGATRIGERDRRGAATGNLGSPLGSGALTSGSVGGDVDRGTSFSIQWSDGGTRRKISGDLPKYPSGVNVEAQIKILTVVMPDGTVKSTHVAQKANTKLEEAALKEVRDWRFEPLRPSHPQEEQSCVITFLFTLK